MSAEVKWATPPAAARGNHGSRSSEHVDVADQLKARPGQWALLKEGHRDMTLVNRIKKGIIRAYAPAGAFEATSRVAGRNADGKPLVDTYVRYVGDGTQAVAR